MRARRRCEAIRTSFDITVRSLLRGLKPRYFLCLERRGLKLRAFRALIRARRLSSFARLDSRGRLSPHESQSSCTRLLVLWHIRRSMPSPADSKAGRAAFNHPDFVLLQIARFLIVAAVEMQAVAVGWQVYQITHPALHLGLVGLGRFLPGILLFLVLWH